MAGPIGMPPSSQHGAGGQAGPHGSQAGAIGGGQGSDRPPHGERNSMNDGRRQLPPPKQLLQPGAAARADRAIARQMNRDMTSFSSGRRAVASRGR